MISVREMVECMKEHAISIDLALGTNVVPGFNYRDPISMDAFGDFAVKSILGSEDGHFEIVLAIKPVRCTE